MRCIKALPLLCALLPWIALAAPRRTPTADFSGRTFLRLETPFGVHRYRLQESEAVSPREGETHFEGVELRGKRVRSRISASVTEAGLHLFAVAGTANHPKPVFLSKSSGSRRWSLRRPVRNALARCGNEDVIAPFFLRARATEQETPRLDPARVYEVTIHADELFIAQAEVPWQTDVREIVVAADALYAAQAGLRLKLVETVPSPSLLSLTQPDAQSLLEQFRALVTALPPQAPADMHHLLTGRTLDDFTIGLSYVGSACAQRGAFSYSLSQRVDPALQPLLLAHELAHSLGVVHDNAPGSIMNSRIGTPDLRFTPESLLELIAFVLDRGSCLAEAPSTQVSLRAKLRPESISFTAQIRSLVSENCTVALKASTDAKKIGSLTALPSASSLISGELMTFDGYSPTRIRWEAKELRRPLRTQRLYVRALATCGEKSYISDITTLVIPQAPKGSKKKLRTFGRWLDALNRALVRVE